MSKNLATLEKSQISELKPIFWSSVDKVRVGRFSNDNGDGNENVTNLHI